MNNRSDRIPDAAQAVLDFWFGPVDRPGFGETRPEWFRPDRAFDGEIRDRFLGLHHQAAGGELQAWQDAPRSCLALIVVLDQFSRNLFRGTAAAFATDPLALAIAVHAVELGFDRHLLPVERWFIYLPFEHSEVRADQERSVALWSGLADDPASAGAIAFAQRHWEVIDRFGRFPHRNSILGRTSTPEEEAFLQEPGSSF